MIPDPHLPVAASLSLQARVRFWGTSVRIGLRRHRLPDLVRRLGSAPRRRPTNTSPEHLGRIVERTLHRGPVRERCLLTSLVLYRLLREEGRRAELVIGLPDHPRDQEAHAWVEIDGVDVGPPPGRGRHAELARYG